MSHLVGSGSWLLIPVIGLVQVDSQAMADRYSYIPIIGLFIIVAWGGGDLTKGFRHRKILLASLACAAIVASVILTWKQLGYWHDNVSLFRHALHVTPDNNGIVSLNLQYTHYNEGLDFELRGDLDATIHEYREALRIDPDFVLARTNLGRALANKGDFDAAIKEVQTALSIDSTNFEARRLLGLLLKQKEGLICPGNSQSVIPATSCKH